MASTALKPIETQYKGGLPKSFNEGKSSRSINRLGQHYGKLMVVAYSGKNKHGSHLWLCRCQCGGEKVYSSGKLTMKKAISCGCVWARNKETINECAGWKRKPTGESSFNVLYYQYQYNARIAGRSFNLDKNTFRALTSQSCFYCGCPPKQSRMTSGKGFGNGQYIHNGIDRIDNDLGYEPDNVRSCCKQCNRAKGSQGETEFLQWVNRLAAYTAARSARFEHGERG